MGKLGEFIKLGFGLAAGSTIFYTMIALYSVVLVGLGFLLFTKYNKPNTELYSDFTVPQIIGIVLGVLGLLPWLNIIIQIILYTVLQFGVDAVSDRFF